MKRMILVLCLLIIASGIAFANEPFELRNERGNGGYEIGILALNLTDVNEVLETMGYLPLNQVVLLNGGGGMGGTRAGVRVGGFGCGGEVYSEAPNGEKAILGIGFGGFVYEDGIYVKGNTDIAIGAMIGGGGATLELNSLHNGEFNKGFIACEPRVSIHQQISSRWGLDVRAGYLFTYDFNTDWHIGENIISGPFRYLAGPRIGIRFTYGF